MMTLYSYKNSHVLHITKVHSVSAWSKLIVKLGILLVHLIMKTVACAYMK